MFIIEKLTALEILDSRGRPTVRTACTLKDGYSGAASVPSGASTGSAEALELRDRDSTRYRGLGCRQAVANVNERLNRSLSGRPFADQEQLDGAMLQLDGTANKSSLGANAILSVSLAFARAASAQRGVPLYRHFAEFLANPEPDSATTGNRQAGRDAFHRVPDLPFRVAEKIRDGVESVPAKFAVRPSAALPRPTINLFSGGKHAGGQSPIQDVLVVPVSARTIEECLSMTFEVYQCAAELCARKYGMRALVADEGGLAPPFASAQAMLDDAVETIRAAHYEPGRDVALAVDAASSHFCVAGRYQLGDESLNSARMIERLIEWVARYPIVSLEDGLSEDDWDHWPKLKASLSGKCLTVGDDLLCTDPQRIQRAIEACAADTLLLKVNQIGTLTEAREACRLARSARWRVTVSARSGETEDDWLADLAVGWGGDQIKIGSITRSERLSKYNRLLAIEAETGLPIVAWP
ncbi:MAG: enolase [Verrucomicrobia bacterium]|nr:enolase [Verrucomicrobiota bacterium]